MSIEQDAKRTTKEFIKIGFDVTKSIAEVLSLFFREEIRGKGIKEYKDYFGKEFESKEQMILSAKAQGIKDFSNITISDQNNQIKLLKKYCKQRGVDILLETRPKNMQEIYDRYMQNGDKSLTTKELDYFKAFTIKKDDNIILMDSGAIVQFKSKDIDLMEDIVKDLEQYVKDINERKQQATIKVSEAKEKVKDTLDKTIDKFKGKGLEK